MDKKLKLIVRLFDGKKIALLSRKFGISRKTGHKDYDFNGAIGNA